MNIASVRVLSLTLLVCALAAPAMAMPGASSAPRITDPTERFTQMDTDSNGSVCWNEFSKARPNLNENAFKSIDSNKDGGISPDEWKNFSSGHGGMAKTPDMGAMMKAMGGMGAPSAAPAPSQPARPLITPPVQKRPEAPVSSMPLIMPPRPEN